MMSKEHLEEKIRNNRLFMKSRFTENDYVSDQQKQLPQPPLTKAASSNHIISLTKDFSGVMKESNYLTLLQERISNRAYKKESINLEQLAFLLWTTQGVKFIVGNNYATKRPVPSGGARHAFETYLAIFNVEGLEKGIYHYLPIEHSIEFIASVDNLEDAVNDSLAGQNWASEAAVVFYYSVIPYRGEWRYSADAHRVMLIDAGHVVQNLYLSCQAIGCGTCAIAAFDQAVSDKLLGLDGEEEFLVYAAPVGVI